MSLSRMKNPSWLCPYCDTEYRSTLFVKHLFSKHFTQMFDPETTYGEKNIKLFTIDRKEAKPLCLYFPDGHKNPLIDICLGCMTGCAKRKSAEKHFEKPMKHNVLHLEKYNELKEQILKAKEGKATPLGSNSSIVEPAPCPQLNDYSGVQRLAWRLMKEMWKNEKLTEEKANLVDYLSEHFDSSDTLEKEVYENRDDQVEEPYLKEPVWSLYGELPFPKDPETLIRMFEKGKEAESWVSRINPASQRKDKSQEKKVLPPPAPKPAEPTPPPEPVQEPAPEPKPTPQPLASVLYQSYKPPPVAPSLPTIIQKTKRN